MSKAVKAVTNVVKSVVKAVGSVISGVVKAVGKVVSAVVNFVASPFMGLFGVPDAPSDAGEAARQQGVLLQQEGSNVNIPVIYGYRKVGGTVTYAETGSTNNKYLWVAYVFSEGPVEGLREVWIDDNQLPTSIVGSLNGGSIVDITDTTSKYAGRVRLQWYPGVYFSTPSSTTIGANSILKDAPSWKSNMHHNGMAVLFARYEWKDIVTQEDSDNNPFAGNIPQVQISVLGRRVASLLPGTGQELYEYGASGYAERYSTNPAEILLDYLRNPRYGKGLKNSEIDWDSFRKAALKCNTEVTYVTGIRGPILTTNYVLDTGSTIFNNVKVLLTNMRGYLPYVQGKYKLKIEDAGNETDITSGSATIVQTYTKDNIVGDITYTGIERSAKYNQVVVSYVDPDQKWSVQQVVYPESESERQTYITRDGGRENKAEITFPALTNYAIAKDMARLIFNKSRFQDTCSFTADSSAFELEPGDNIYISSNILDFGTNAGAGAIPWRIVSIKLNNDYTFDIGCVRNPDSLYPHTRVGEIDVVLPTYVPKGATIYYPGTGRTPPVGLVPPTKGIQPGEGSTNETTHPPSTDPTDTTITTSAIGTGSISSNVMTITAMTSGTFAVGMAVSGTGINSATTITAILTGSGGVGTYTVSVSQTVSSTTITGKFITATGGGGVGDSDGDVNDDGVNDNPTPPVPVKPLEDYVKIDRVSYSVENGQIYGILEFLQPDHPMYESTVIWYKRSIASETVWRLVEATDKPGPGSTIKVKIGPLIKGPYTVKTRVKYNTKEYSKFVGSANLNASDVVLTEDPVDYQEVAGEGWNLNTTPGENKRDTFLKNIIGAPILSGGSPSSPRQMTITITQDIDQIPINGYIAGMNIYYKPKPNKYWKTTSVEFAQTYLEGSAYQFTLPVTLGPSGSDQFYDFVFRFRYKDGTESTVQYRNMGVRVESDPFGAYSFNPFIYSTPAAQGRESVSAYALITEANSPPGSVTDTREMKLSFKSISNALSGTDRIFFALDTPSAADRSSWYGVRVYSKEVLASPTSTVTTNIKPVPADALGYYVSLEINYDSIYEYVIVPLVDYNGVETEGNQAWYFSGYVHDRSGDADYPSTGNWLQQFTKEQTTTTLALAKIGTATPAGPNRYTQFSAVSFTELLTGGNPRDPREISISITQTAGSTGNTRLNGLKIYYKPSTFGYWSTATHTFSGYTQGSPYTFTFSGDLGSPVASPGLRDCNYDFILRFTYDDGSESLYQARKSEVQIQGGTYPNQIIGSSLIELASTYTFVPIENAPPGAVTDPRTLTVSIDQTVSMAATNSTSILFYLNQPVDPQKRWNGCRLYYRKVIPGQNPSFLSQDFLPVTKDADARLLIKQLITYDEEYEFVLVPIVTYDRVKVECNSAWYGRGSIHNRLINGQVPNWWQLLKFELIDTSVALNRIKESFPQTDATIQVTSWTRVQTDNTGIDPRYYYYELKFYHQHITNYNEIDIYRRSRISSVSANYFGIGRWEKMTVTSTNTSPGGTVTVNLRAPISHLEFYPSFTGFPETTNNTLVWSLYSTYKPLPPGTQFDDFLIVVKSNGAYSNKALLMPNIPRFALTARVDGLNTSKPQIVTVSNYNTTTINYLRRLTESRSSVATNLLVYNKTGSPGNVTLPTTSPAII